MHTEGGFRAKSAIFADFNEVRGVHTGADKKEVKSKNHDFIGENRRTGETDRRTWWRWLGNWMALAGELDGIVIKA